MTKKVAIIGAGISGLTCARILRENGMHVQVFEKSRGPGGRMSTRRAEESLRFDHGAQYFTVRDETFASHVRLWQEDEIVARWNGRIVVLNNGEIVEEKNGTDRYVGVPGMNAICRKLANDLEIAYQTKVMPLVEEGEKWTLRDDNLCNLGSFDIVLSSAPAKQTAELFGEFPTLANEAAKAMMTGCWALMVSFKESLQQDYNAAFVKDSSLSWIARNQSKPGRPQAEESWVIHASPEWSEENLEKPASVIAEQMINEFWKTLGTNPKPTDYVSAHRWRYALPSVPLDEKFLFDSELMLGACGDWCGGPRVEGAFLSGNALTNHILSHICKE